MNIEIMQKYFPKKPKNTTIRETLLTLLAGSVVISMLVSTAAMAIAPLQVQGNKVLVGGQQKSLDGISLFGVTIIGAVKSFILQPMLLVLKMNLVQTLCVLLLAMAPQAVCKIIGMIIWRV